MWDQPALDALTSMRAQGITIPVTTVDLGLESSIEIAKGGPLKATGSQRPYDQGVAEALAMMKALVGQTPPAWVGVQSLAGRPIDGARGLQDGVQEGPARRARQCLQGGQTRLQLTPLDGVDTGGGSLR